VKIVRAGEVVARSVAASGVLFGVKHYPEKFLFLSQWRMLGNCIKINKVVVL
jgi:hypothetical protein